MSERPAPERCVEREAVVTEVAGQRARIEADRPGACSACNARLACGAGALERSRSRAALWVENPDAAQVGETVSVEISSGALLRGAATVYLLPLFAMLTAALLADQWANATSVQTALWAVGGLGGGLWAARLLLRRPRPNTVKIRRRAERDATP